MLTNYPSIPTRLARCEILHLIEPGIAWFTGGGPGSSAGVSYATSDVALRVQRVQLQLSSSSYRSYITGIHKSSFAHHRQVPQRPLVAESAGAHRAIL